MTYLDYQATTPLAPEALEAMLPWLRYADAMPTTRRPLPHWRDMPTESSNFRS